MANAPIRRMHAPVQARGSERGPENKLPELLVWQNGFRGTDALSVVGGPSQVGDDTSSGAEMIVNGSIHAKWVRQSMRFVGTAVVTISAVLSSPIGTPFASGAPCPDVEVVFARGTMEPPGVGGTGQAFVDSLSSRVGGKSVGVYPVNYPASLDFPTAVDGVIDAGNHVQSMAANCPNTKMVLGGYSQGAAVTGYVTSDAIPAGYTPPASITGPMAPSVANHVAAVALFGKPSNAFLDQHGAPPITIGHLYSGKTIELCADGDPICSPDGNDNAAHTLYSANGMESQAADFVARQLGSRWE
jgi:cutinase-like protein